jgi:hypothetical protein
VSAPEPLSSVFWLYVFGTIAFTVVLIVILQTLPQRARRPLMLTATFVGGLFYVLEFFVPVRKMPNPQDPDAVGNFMTPFILPVAGTLIPIVTAVAFGLGVINLFQIHGKRILKKNPNAFFSYVFFIGFFTTLVIGILSRIHPNAINKNLYDLIVVGGYQNLDATMFSIIAFYITSAAYRAFRVKSVEATLLLVTAVIVMLGQISRGQLLTNWLPEQGVGFLGNFRFEVIRDWILNKANTPAIRAINFGLGIGSLAVALRIWLGLERGSYFDSQG